MTLSPYRTCRVHVILVSIILLTGGSVGKESTCNAGDLSLIPGLGRSPEGGHGNPLQYSYLENSHGPRSLAGYSPWGHKELDATEQLNTAYFVNSPHEGNPINDPGLQILRIVPMVMHVATE